MSSIEFKKVDTEAYKDVAPYLDALIPFITFIGDLYFVDIEDHRFLVTSEDGLVIIVENYNKTLNTYTLEFDEAGRITKYFDGLYEYEMSMDGLGSRGIKSVDCLSKTVEQLIYSKPTDEDPTTCLDYYQYIPGLDKCLIFSYDVSRRSDTLDAAIAYATYNYPSKIVVNQVKYLLQIIARKKENIMIDDEKTNMYAKSFLRLGTVLLTGSKRYSKDKVLYALEDLGYQRKIPNRMSELLLNTDDELKLLVKVSKDYKERRGVL